MLLGLICWLRAVVAGFVNTVCVCVLSVEWLVVDESDKLFEDGRSGFREQLAAVFQACSSPRVRRALYSATCAPDVEQWCRLNLDNLVSVNIGHRYSTTHSPLFYYTTLPVTTLSIVGRYH